MCKPIEIFFATDNKFVKHACVAIASILHNANDSDIHNIYIITTDLSDNNINHIKSLKVIKDFNLEILYINKSLFKNYISPNYINSNATYFRYLIPNLKPNINKALYLDCDLVIKKSLSELFNINLKNYLIAGVQDPHIACLSTCIKPHFDRCNIYINAGVLLFNCEQMRKDNFTEKCFEITPKLNTQTYFGADQDVINIITGKNKLIIAPKYNLVTSFLDVQKNSLYSDEEINNALANPVIIHFSDRKKPWMIRYFPLNDYAYEYYKYLKLTDFYDKNIKIKLIFLNKNTKNSIKAIRDNMLLKIILSCIMLPIDIIKLFLSPLSSMKIVNKYNRSVNND